MAKLDWEKANKKARAALYLPNVQAKFSVKRSVKWAKIIGADCPNCGSQTVKRTGKFGSFFGCRSYPKCRGIIKIK